MIALLHIIEHVISSPGGPLYFARRTAKRDDIKSVLASETRFAVPARGVFSKVSAGVDADPAAVGYGRIIADPGKDAPSGFAVFSIRQREVLVSEGAVPISQGVRKGRLYFGMYDRVATGLAVANPNDQAATLSFYLTDSNGGNFNAGAITIPAYGQVARFLDEPPFNAGTPALGALTFESNLDVCAVGLRRHTNERSELLMTTLPIVDLEASPESSLVFPHFADGAGWRTEVWLVNPGEAALKGSVRLTSPGRPADTLDYSIPPRTSRRIQTEGTTSMVRTGFVRVIPEAGSQAPDGALVLTYKRGGVAVSEASVGAARPGNDFFLYAEGSESVQTGIAVANLSAAAISVSLELTAASGESLGSAALPIEADGQAALFLDQIRGLTVPREFEGLLRVAAASPAGIAATGLRGRKNERGDFLVTSIPAAGGSSLLSAGMRVIPYLIDGGGYSTRFFLFGKSPSSAPEGTLRFHAQSGRPLTLPLR